MLSNDIGKPVMVQLLRVRSGDSPSPAAKIISALPPIHPAECTWQATGA